MSHERNSHQDGGRTHARIVALGTDHVEAKGSPVEADVPGVHLDHDEIEVANPSREEIHRMEEAREHRLRESRRVHREPGEFTYPAPVAPDGVELRPIQLVGGNARRRVEAQADGSGKTAFVVRGESPDVRALLAVAVR